MTPHTTRHTVGAIVLAAVAILPAACGQVDAGAPVPQNVEPVTVTVTTAEATKKTVPTVVRATGTFVADESSDVTPQTAGSVIETPVSVGDLVTAGRMIVRLDERNATLNLNHAQAALEQAEAQAQNAQVEAARHAELVQSGDISRSAYEKLTDTTGGGPGRRRPGPGPPRQRRESARRHQDQRPVQRSRQCPADRGGRVRHHLLEGRHHHADRSDQARASGARSAGGAAAPGMPVRAEVSAYPGTIFSGAISARNVAIDPNSRAMLIEVSFRNRDSRLGPGMFGTAEVLLPGDRARHLYSPRRDPAVRQRRVLGGLCDRGEHRASPHRPARGAGRRTGAHPHRRRGRCRCRDQQSRQTVRRRDGPPGPTHPRSKRRTRCTSWQNSAYGGRSGDDAESSPWPWSEVFRTSPRCRSDAERGRADGRRCRSQSRRITRRRSKPKSPSRSKMRSTPSAASRVRSTSVEGLSTVVITFPLEKNGDVGAQEVRDKVNLSCPICPKPPRHR